MFRAFNGECDAAVARVKYNNVEVMERRMTKAFERVNKLSVTTGCAIEPVYLRLKLAELHLTHEFHEKRQAEREEQRQIREQMREEMKAKKEAERAQREAEKDEARYEKALAKARAEAADAAGAKQDKLRSEIEELERRLAEAHANKERAVSRAQMTRAGHVYVISNVGSFGDDVYKIGMTRRLDPMDRVRELGDASVPFRFDVHAVIYSDDAPGLEAELHRQFDGHRVNRGQHAEGVLPRPAGRGRPRRPREPRGDRVHARGRGRGVPEDGRAPPLLPAAVRRLCDGVVPPLALARRPVALTVRRAPTACSSGRAAASHPPSAALCPKPYVSRQSRFRGTRRPAYTVVRPTVTPE